MRKFVLIAAAVAALSWPGHAAEPSKYERLFDTLWHTVDDNFYDPNFIGHDWNAIGARYRARLLAVHDDKAFARLASAMLGEIGTSHLYILPPKVSSASGTGIGVQWQSVAGQTIADEIDPLSDARVAGVRPGDRLLSPYAALVGAKGSMASVTVEHCDGKRQTLRIRRVAAFWPPVHPGFAWHIVSSGPGHSIGYLRIDRFDDGAAALADTAMDELKDTDALIIDIRQNTGGNMSALRLASYFTGPAAPNIALLARDYLKALGHPLTAADIAKVPQVSGVYTTDGVQSAVGSHNGAMVFMSEDMGAKRYTRPVVVLIGGDTGSAAEGFAWAMRLHATAKFIGRKTEGALLSGVEFDLPDGWRVTVPVQGLWAPDGTDFRDRSVTPDIPVHWSRDDFCAGRDPDIARALTDLGAR